MTLADLLIFALLTFLAILNNEFNQVIIRNLREDIDRLRASEGLCPRCWQEETQEIRKMPRPNTMDDTMPLDARLH